MREKLIKFKISEKLKLGFIVVFQKCYKLLSDQTKILVADALDTVDWKS